jgi:hypothetical protein
LSELRLRSEAAEIGDEEDGEEEASDHPLVHAMPRLRSDVQALLSLMSADKPVLRRTRCRKTSKAYYGFGDASGLGFGATIQIGESIWYEYGQWVEEVVEQERSSNWREVTNLVEFLERSVKKHGLGGSEIFIFTDNNTSEAAFWKGTLSSPLLFELVLRLRKLEMDHNLIIHVVHVSGKRMIDQGTDGLSRADHSQGVVMGRDIHHWVPLNESAFVWSKHLETWLAKAIGGLGFTTLSPEGWFTTGHGYGNYV